jgi:hypothetical protein
MAAPFFEWMSQVAITSPDRPGNGYLDYPFKNKHFETDKDILPLVLAPLNIQKMCR